MKVENLRNQSENKANAELFFRRSYSCTYILKRCTGTLNFPVDCLLDKPEMTFIVTWHYINKLN